MSLSELGIEIVQIIKRWPSSCSVITLAALLLFVLWSFGAIGDDGFVRKSEFSDQVSKIDKLVISLTETERRQKRWYAARIADDIRAKVKLLCDRESRTPYERDVLNEEIEALQEEYDKTRGRKYDPPPCSLL